MRNNFHSYSSPVRFLGLAVALGTLYGQAVNNPAPTGPVTGDAASGKSLYYSFACYACHGYNGETGERVFVGRWGNLATEESFIRFLRGRANAAPVIPSTSMPNFGESSLSDQQAKDIYAYIRTFKSTAPALKDIAVLNAIVSAAKRAAVQPKQRGGEK
jgi:mono/diheme cytochrome c family protein